MVEPREKTDVPIVSQSKSTVAILLILISLVCCSQQEDQSWVSSSDRRLQRMADKVLEDVTEFSGLEVLDQIQIDYRTKEEISKYVQSRLERDLPESVEQYIIESYSLLGLFPKNLDLRQTLANLYGEQVIGFYDPEDRALYLQEEVPLENLGSLLVHEMVHALQDQHFDLTSLMGSSLNNDERTAVLTAIEGHATLVMLELLSENNGNGSVDLADVSDFEKSIVSVFESTNLEKERPDPVPLVLREGMFFPYIHGVRFVKTMRIREGNKSVPFGANLPKSTNQILHYGEFSFDESDASVTIQIQPDDKWIKLYENTLGALEVGAFLENLIGQKVDFEGWKGDRFALLESVEGSRTFVWFSVWDTVQDRDQFSGIVESNLEFLPKNSRLFSMNFGGIPGVRMEIGPEINVEAILEKQ